MNDKTVSQAPTSVWVKLGQSLDFFEKWLLAFFLAAIVILIFSGVLSRFIFHYSIAASEELARFIFVWSALLGAAAALKTGEHGGIPLLANKFSPRGQRIVEIFVATGVVVFLCYLVIMTGVSTKKSFLSGQISTTTEIPIWTINFGMMIAFAIGFIRCIQGFLLGAFSPELATTDLTKK
ncbi:MAG: TRAP transporter small permease [Rhodospirillales bacterium]|nr:TRAP transporter small permease [Rhodospirillales bacterium]